MDLNNIDIRGYTADAAVAEVEREVAIRKPAYAKWVAEGKLSADRAVNQLAGMMKAAQILGWIASTGPDRIKKALATLEWIEKVGPDNVKKAIATLGWIEKTGGERVKQALDVLAFIERSPEATRAFADAVGSESFKQLTQAFPNSTLAGFGKPDREAA